MHISANVKRMWSYARCSSSGYTGLLAYKQQVEGKIVVNPLHTFLATLDTLEK
jgi:hypothetical protein